MQLRFERLELNKPQEIRNNVKTKVEISTQTPRNNRQARWWRGDDCGLFCSLSLDFSLTKMRLALSTFPHKNNT